MEDLVATVEDARYVNAVVQDDKPQEPWKFPSEEDLADYIARKKKEDPAYLEEATIKETTLGKYLHGQYANPSGTPGGKPSSFMVNSSFLTKIFVSRSPVFYRVDPSHRIS